MPGVHGTSGGRDSEEKKMATWAPGLDADVRVAWSRRGNRAQVWFLKRRVFEVYPAQVVEGDLEAAAGGDLVAFPTSGASPEAVYLACPFALQRLRKPDAA
jgi:hypothetical protein